MTRRSRSGWLNREENLLLLCGVHHHPVDRNGSTYTTEELLAWKEKQVTDGGGYLLQDRDLEELAARLESALDELVQATRLQLQVRLVGGRVGLPSPPQVVCVPLEALEEMGLRGAHLFRVGRLIGVEVENGGTVGAEVEAAGIDIDLGPGHPEPWQYAFPANMLTPWRFPCRVDGRATRRWFDDADSIRGFVDHLFTGRGHVPRRFRAWAWLGNGDRPCSDWLDRADLPIWEPGVGELQLRARYGELG